MWSFEGEYKKKPKQSLGGKSKAVDRKTFLTKLKTEREQRELQRKREESSIKIQSWFRGCKSRKLLYEEFRKDCDSLIKNLDADHPSKENVETIIIIITKVFDQKKDADRLLSVCQFLIKFQKYMFQWISEALNKWKFFISKLISLALCNMLFFDKDQTKHIHPHSVPLRLLEIVSNPDAWNTKLRDGREKEFLTFLFVYLLRNGYYDSLLGVVLAKVPNVYERRATPPNHLGESVALLMLQPIKVVTSLRDPDVDAVLYSHLCVEVFARLRRGQVINFVLPSIVASAASGSMAEPLLAHLNAVNDTALFGDGYGASPSSLLYAVLSIVRSSTSFGSLNAFITFLNVTGRLMEVCHRSLLFGKPELEVEDADQSSDSDEEQMDCAPPDNVTDTGENILAMCFDDLNDTERVTWILHYVEKYVDSSQMLVSFAKLFHYVCVGLKYKVHDCRLFYSVVLRRNLLLRPMWTVLCGLQQGNVYQYENGTNKNDSSGTQLLQVVSHGYPLSPSERGALVPLLYTFSASLMAVLATLHDSELLGQNENFKNENFQCESGCFPFTVDELIRMSSTLRDVCVGLVTLAHPDMRMASFIDPQYKNMWSQCFKVCIGVVTQIQLRDTRRRFCPDGHWLSHKVTFPLKSDGADAFASRHRRRYRRFEAPRWMSKDELESDGPPLSVADQRRSTLLQEMPFVYPFESRMTIFSTLVTADRSQHQEEATYGVGPDIRVSIRRTHLYEDSFDKLSPNNEPNLRLKMRIHLLNAVGIDEAGIDGGGIFREFLSELLKTAFDPNRGFFVLTRDNTLYPNPSIKLIHEDYQKHYYFIGRMLGKALYENLLVEIPLAGFFLSKLLSRNSTSVEFHHLDTLDPELCKHLLSLKNYDGDVKELGLDFSVLNSELGQQIVEELIPNGANVAVTSENCIEYIYRMADYKLNKQIANQCNAFKQGLFNVIESRWLRLFDWRELRMMISGAANPIDIEGLKMNTLYTGVYSEDHPTIVNFWTVVSSFDEKQRRQLLKFVTSCSRPPLLGFKELFPMFCIQPSGSDDRLPSASTCMNLLKLPEYKDRDTLRDKLLYAINASAGFELS